MKGTKKLIMLAVALVLTLAMSTTTAFAWFTMNDTVTVKGFKGEATAAEGLLITKASATVTSADDTEAVYRAYTDLQWADVETLAALTLVQDDFAAATPTEKRQASLNSSFTSDMKFVDVNGADVADADNNYLTQKFFFRSDVEMTIALETVTFSYDTTAQGTRTVQPSVDIPENTFGTHSGIAATSNVTAKIQDALRIGIVNAAGNLIAVYQLGADGNWDDTADTWAPTIDGTAVSLAGKNMANALYRILQGTNPTIESAPDYAEVALTAGTETGDAVKTTVYTLDTATTLATTAQITAAVGNPYYAEFTVVIWLEGTDGDCINDILEDSFQIDLAFVGTEVTGG